MKHSLLLLSLAACSRPVAAIRRGDPLAIVWRQLPQSNHTIITTSSSQTPALIPDAPAETSTIAPGLSAEDRTDSTITTPNSISTSKPGSISSTVDSPAQTILDGDGGESPTEGEEGSGVPTSSASSPSSTSDEMVLQFFGDPGGVTTLTTPRTEAPAPLTSPRTSPTDRIKVPSTIASSWAIPPSSVVPETSRITKIISSFTTVFKPRTTYSRPPVPKWNGTLSVAPTSNRTQSFTRYSASRTKGDSPSTLTDEPPAEESDDGPHMCITEVPYADETTYSIIYTETTTFYGDPSDYTPPYPPITTPATCKRQSARESYQFTVICSTEKGVTSCTSETIGAEPTINISPGETTTSLLLLPRPSKTVTFITTEKNPSVIFSPVSTPGYGHEEPTDTREGRPHPTAEPDAPSPTEAGNPSPHVPAVPQSMKQQTTPTFVVTAAPTKVIINDKTITDLGPSKTTVVTVGGETFTINPSQVIGGGSTIDRPGPPGGVFVPGSTTTAGGLEVVVAPSGSTSVVVIDGTTLSIGPTASVTVIKSQTVTIGPSGIVFPSETVPVANVVQTEVVVAGGEMITAIGKTVVVIRSTTITYGPGISARTEIIDDDTIVIGSSGVVVHSTTIGGPNAGPSDVAIEIVGGATITQIGPSVVVIGGSTYTVGPGTGKTTTVVGGETITLGPDGISVSTLSFPYPFGPTIITTIKPSATVTADTPPQTSSKDSAGASGPRWDAGVNIGFCIAIGVWVMGYVI